VVQLDPKPVARRARLEFAVPTVAVRAAAVRAVAVPPVEVPQEQSEAAVIAAPTTSVALRRLGTTTDR
jgi:hypothetical protein